MKILIISMETWSNNTNGGNVLTNIFNGFEAEFAQVYCSSGMPDNSICSKYFQMTDSMAIRNILKKQKMGINFTSDGDYSNTLIKTDNTIENVKKIGSFEFLRVAREIVWGLSDYKNDRLKQFIEEFNPDIVFAPCYGVTYMLSLTKYVEEITKKPIISYISDDSFSLRQFRVSPVFWINRIVVRSRIKKIWSYYSLIYTMTNTQKQLMSKLGKPMKILCKSGKFDKRIDKKQTNTPIRLIYAGGLYLNRWKTLVALANKIKEINLIEKKFILDIYTGTALTPKVQKILNDEVNCFIHPTIPFEQLVDEYEKSDIALHVESFDLKNRLNVRMSFSTKIIDCLDSGCAVMAICDKKQGGFSYLKEQDAAICIDSPKKIEETLERIVRYPEMIDDYRRKAVECGKRNHLQEKILNNMIHDFQTIAMGEKIENNTSN